jgi:hypothetical protein
MGSSDGIDSPNDWRWIYIKRPLEELRVIRPPYSPCSCLPRPCRMPSRSCCCRGGSSARCGSSGFSVFYRAMSAAGDRVAVAGARGPSRRLLQARAGLIARQRALKWLAPRRPVIQPTASAAFGPGGSSIANRFEQASLFCYRHDAWALSSPARRPCPSHRLWYRPEAPSGERLTLGKGTLPRFVVLGGEHGLIGVRAQATVLRKVPLTIPQVAPLFTGNFCRKVESYPQVVRATIGPTQVNQW